MRPSDGWRGRTSVARRSSIAGSRRAASGGRCPMRNRPGVLLLILAGVPWGCATVRLEPSVLGRSVRVEPPKGGETKPLEGELLAVTGERMWIRGASGVTEVPG